MYNAVKFNVFKDALNIFMDINLNIFVMPVKILYFLFSCVYLCAYIIKYYTNEKHQN